MAKSQKKTPQTPQKPKAAKTPKKSAAGKRVKINRAPFGY